METQTDPQLAPTRPAAIASATRPRHIILSAFGSYGDVLPMAGLGATMARRGWRVQIITNPYFKSVIEAAGAELLPLGTAEEYLDLTRHPDLWHPTRGIKLVLSRGLVAYLGQTWKLLTDNYVPGQTALAAHGLDLASRILQERAGAPLASVHFAPFAVMTFHDTPRYIGNPTVHWGPAWYKRLMFRLASRFYIDPIVAPAVNVLRDSVGLPPIKDVFGGWNNSPQLVLGMWPEWFGAMQPDYPPQMRLAGFPLWEAHPEEELSAEVEAFLRRGEAPIVFAPGSANVQGREFFAAAAEACRLLGRRGMLVTKYPEQLPSHLPLGVERFGFVPFGKLLPRAAALVHHGGIGTCGQGFASGIPQVVMPMAYDQLDNGLRAARLGVGAVVPVRKFKAPRVAAELKRLLEDPAIKSRAAEIATRCRGSASLAAACDLIEGLA